MPFLNDYSTSQDLDFRKRLRIALAKVALAVVGETPSTNGARDEKRHRLGVAVLNDPDTHLDRIAYAVVAPGTLSTSSTDGDIEFMVSSVFSDLAGVTHHEATT
jgi:hypothetical protein